MGRWTKACVLASAAGAITFESYWARLGWSPIPILALAASGAAIVAARRWADGAGGVVIATGYLLPLAFLLATNRAPLWFLSVWTAALFGAFVARAPLVWNYPPLWRLPLVTWALVIAVGSPLVFLRELDFAPSLVWTAARVPPTNSGGGTPLSTTVWLAHVAQVHLVGLLLVDWLSGRFRHRPAAAFERAIALPAGIAIALGSALTVYQGLVDLTFLADGPWAALKRASGPLLDANVSGMVSALWAPAWLALSLRAGTRLGALAAAVAAAICGLAVWATGSRTALLAAGIGLIPTAIAGLWPLLRPGRARRGAIAAVVVLVVALSVVMGVGPRLTTIGPLARAREILPDLSRASLATAAKELWERHGYGMAAAGMIREHPFTGVGVGAFHLFATDYAELAGKQIPPDNAQNWYRHQLAELGIVGSVGWMLWLIVFGRSWLQLSADPVAVALKAAVAGFALASLVGMPGQTLAVTISVWTLVVWDLSLAEERRGSTAPNELESWTADRRATAAGLIVAAAFATGTVIEARGSLRVANRAKRFGFDYSYGVDRRPDPGPNSVWTRDRAVIVTPAQGDWLKVTVSVAHPDAHERSVYARVWVDGQRVIRRRIRRGVVVTEYVRLSRDSARFVLEAAADRTYRPDGCHDSRCERGLLLGWEFVSAPPR